MRMRGWVWLFASALIGACSQSREATPDASRVDASETGACGTRGGASCPDGEVCFFPAGSCGADDGGGTCEERPGICPGVVEPVCGCDGTTYSNACLARAAGASIRSAGPCGGVSCDRRDVRCRIAEPVCPEGQTAEVVDGCYGDCVAIDECECSEAEACPSPDRYTCHLFRMRCGPYL